MSQSLIGILIVLLGGGTVGGLAAFLSQLIVQDPGGDPAPVRPQWYAYILLGIVAAACVPLLLSLLKSGLISELFEANNGDAGVENYLILLGLAVIAGFSSQRFLKSISDQLIRRIESSERAAVRADEKAENATEIARDAALELERADVEVVQSGEETATAVSIIGHGGRVDISGQADDPSVAPGPALPAKPLSVTERKILRSLTLMSRRTITGIADDSGLARARIVEHLENLADRGLIVPTVSQKTGGARWQITAAGVAALSAPLP